jgi:hypothetical protein
MFIFSRAGSALLPEPKVGMTTFQSKLKGSFALRFGGIRNPLNSCLISILLSCSRQFQSWLREGSITN